MIKKHDSYKHNQRPNVSNIYLLFTNLMCSTCICTLELERKQKITIHAQTNAHLHVPKSKKGVSTPVPHLIRSLFQQIFLLRRVYSCLLEFSHCSLHFFPIEFLQVARERSNAPFTGAARTKERKEKDFFVCVLLLR